MMVVFIPLDIDYVDDKENKTWIRIFGRTKDGKRCCVLDSCEAFFYLIPKEGVDIKKYVEKVKKTEVKIANRIGKVKKIEIVKKNFVGKPITALKVFVTNHKDIIPIKDVVKNFKETKDKQETDINFVTRYIIEKGIKSLQWHEVKGKVIEKKELEQLGLEPLDSEIVIKAEKLTPINKFDFKPKFLAFDIEASEFEVGKGQIIMIAIANEKLKKVITWKRFSNAPPEVEFVKDEKELIEKFKEIIKEEKPDCLVGYFSDGFDLPYLRERANALKIKLDLGLDGSNITFIRGIVGSAKISGIVHIDLFKFIENIIAPTLQSETLTLDEVANELIGEQKLKIDLARLTKEFHKAKDSEIQKFCLYNLQDAVLTAKLFCKLWPNIAEITRLVNEPLWTCSRATYSSLVEHYIIHNINKFNEIIKHRPIHEEIQERRRKGKYTGAFVLQPKPGLYENIAMFDFRSLYPSIIISFNISPSTILEKPEKDCYETPEFEYDGKKTKFYFSKKQGFIPCLLKELIEKRKKVKEELKRKKDDPLLEARNYALKTLANATYGYYAFFGARWYCRECAASATAFGRYYIQKVIEEAKKAGFNVLYADTDSVAFELGNKSEAEALRWQKKINEKLPKDMELELEDFYKRGIFVTTRRKEIGAKKKYAMLAKDGSIKIRGFETVRRDWAKLTKELQDKVLRLVLEEGKPDKALTYVYKVIDDLKAKKIEKEKLIIRTQLKKEIESYAAITPHVVIARRMKKLGLPVKVGSIIEYIITEGKKGKGKELIREKAKLPEECEEKEYDTNYYIEHQIIPAVENIFEVFGITKEQIITRKRQKSLSEF